jgi:cell division protein FtsN
MPFTESTKITRNQFLAISSISLLFSFIFLIAGVISSPFYLIGTGAMLVSALVAIAEYMRKREAAKPAPDLPPVPEAEPAPFAASAEEEFKVSPVVSESSEASLEERIGGVEEPLSPAHESSSVAAPRSTPDLPGFAPPFAPPATETTGLLDEGVSDDPQSVIAEDLDEEAPAPAVASSDAPTHTTVVTITESEDPAVPDEISVVEVDEKPKG